jgi:hypothetical protein
MARLLAGRLLPKYQDMLSSSHGWIAMLRTILLMWRGGSLSVSIEQASGDERSSLK